MPRRVLQGTVVSDRQDKTAIVRVDRQVRHPLYKKIMRRSKKFAVHDPENRCSEGDRVSIRETRPLSKTKRWELVDAGAGAEGGQGNDHPGD